MTTPNPFSAGFNAFQDGIRADKNPEERYGKAWVRWNSGWTAGQMAKRKAERYAAQRTQPEWQQMQEAEGK